LTDQLQSWSDHHGGQHLQISHERSLSGIRQQINRADFVVIDATDDPAQASDAYFQIYKALGPESMTVYTNFVHEGLELLVRRLGVTLLLGPMSIFEWDDFFVHKFPRIIPLSAAKKLPQSSPPEQTPGDEKPVTQTYPVRSIAG
jgi:hypothetical protein